MSRPNTRKGCALAWYLTSFLIGSGMKYLYWKKICHQHDKLHHDHLFLPVFLKHTCPHIGEKLSVGAEEPRMARKEAKQSLP